MTILRVAPLVSISPPPPPWLPQQAIVKHNVLAGSSICPACVAFEIDHILVSAGVHISVLSSACPNPCPRPGKVQPVSIVVVLIPVPAFLLEEGLGGIDSQAPEAGPNWNRSLWGLFCLPLEVPHEMALGEVAVLLILASDQARVLPWVVVGELSSVSLGFRV